MKKDTVIHLTFYDHSLRTPGTSGPIRAEVLGILWKQDKLAYYVVSWVCNSNLRDHNNEVYTILKSTVIRKRRLR